MAKSDAAKRASRLAAKSGGRSNNKRREATWLFPVAIVAILALGVGVIMFARGRADTLTGNKEHPIAQLTAESTGFDHWHAAFQVEVCGETLPAVLSDIQDDLLGIHTHSDGLIHIHPFKLQAAGKNATMERFFDQVGIQSSGDTIKLPQQIGGGDTYVAGQSTCGGKEAQWVLAHWKDAESAALADKPDQVFTKDLKKVRLSEDLGAYTLAFTPKSEISSITPPPSAKDISILGQCDSANPPPQCAELLGGGGTTVPQVVPSGDPTATTAAAPAGAGSEPTPTSQDAAP